MKRIIKLIIILSLFTQVCNAQTIETVEEYKVLYDSIASRVKIVEKDSSVYIGKSFSDFVKILDKCGLKIVQVGMGHYDRGKLYPQHVYAIYLIFTTEEVNDFAYENKLKNPLIFIYFKESKPYEKAMSLFLKYEWYFEKEVEDFYSDAVIKSIGFYDIDKMYRK